MKKELFQLAVALAIGHASAEISPASRPGWSAMVTVVNEGGQPIQGANVEVWYYVNPPPEQTEASEKIQGMTDTNGLFTASHQNTGSIDLGFRASKSGYYSATRGHEFSRFKDEDPAKWNPAVTLLLKKIGRPVPMYAKSAINLKLPVLNKPNGYDLMAGDWVAPYGRGISADIIFTKEYAEKSPSDYFSKITVGFSNTGDGIQEFTVPIALKGSELRSPHEAPADGYQPELAREISAHSGRPSKFDYDPNRIYFFRVRTALDENGNLKSALYGKIYGDFMQFCYYLNPTPNDRNVEFDPKHNLLSGQNVTAP